MKDLSKLTAEELEAELVALEEAEKPHEEAAKLEDLRRKVETKQLVVKYNEELGRRGRDWDLVETPAGAIVFKRGDAGLHRRLMKSEFTDADIDTYLRAQAQYPNDERVIQLFNTYGNLTADCLEVVSKLHGVKFGEKLGKASTS